MFCVGFCFCRSADSIMVLKADKKCLSKLLSDAVPMLCKSGLPLSATFRVEAMIGITLIDSSDEDVVLVCFNQTVDENGKCIQQSYGQNLSDKIDNIATVEHIAQSSDCIVKSSVVCKLPASSATLASVSSIADVPVKSEPVLHEQYTANDPIEIAGEDEESAEGDNYEHGDYEAEDLDDYESAGDGYYPGDSGFVKTEAAEYENDDSNQYVNSEESSEYFKQESWEQPTMQHFKPSYPRQRMPRNYLGPSSSGKIRKPRVKHAALSGSRTNIAKQSVSGQLASQMVCINTFL